RFLTRHTLRKLSSISFGVLLLISIFHVGNCQIRIEVIKHSKLTLLDSNIFISATFNNWSPGDENYKMTKGANGVYYFELPDTLTYFEYKFTQGTWSSVEGNGQGRVRANRVYSRNIEQS